MEEYKLNLIDKVFTDCENFKEYEIKINGYKFVVSDFSKFEDELIKLIEKYRI